MTTFSLLIILVILLGSLIHSDARTLMQRLPINDAPYIAHGTVNLKGFDPYFFVNGINVGKAHVLTAGYWCRDIPEVCKIRNCFEYIRFRFGVGSVANSEPHEVFSVNNRYTDKPNLDLCMLNVWMPIPYGPSVQFAHLGDKNTPKPPPGTMVHVQYYYKPERSWAGANATELRYSVCYLQKHATINPNDGQTKDNELYLGDKPNGAPFQLQSEYFGSPVVLPETGVVIGIVKHAKHDPPTVDIYHPVVFLPHYMDWISAFTKDFGKKMKKE